MHIVFVAALIVASVASVLFGGSASTFIPRYALLVGGLVQSVVPGRSMLDTARHMATAAALWTAGIFGFFVLMMTLKVTL